MVIPTWPHRSVVFKICHMNPKRLQTFISVSEWVVRTGVFYSPSTLPAEAMHASIVDFAVLDLRLAAAFTPAEWLTAAVSADYYVIPDRDITNSSLSLSNGADSGRVLPSGNGLYSMNAARVGLTLITRY